MAGLTTIWSTNITICTAKIPITTATKLKEAYFIPIIRGIAKKKYLERIDISPIALAFARDRPNII